MVGVISAADETMVLLFSGLNPRLFAKLVRQLRREGADPALKGRPWKLTFEDRVLLVAAYWRTNLTMRQLAALFGTSNRPDQGAVDCLVRLQLR
ncbi:transposase family protein [Glycomyces buryatensis]|uniref:Transposase family protein n=1 Tax=Glycomyces buryatensis TaxID=2570927 RepID=A0A4S8QA89_9ACTN|nr:transposase family protein [Glycomyces buryatensis]